MNMRMRRNIKLLGVLSGLFISGGAFAGQLTATLPVTATITGSCSAVAPGNLTFGDYNPLDTTALDASDNIEVTCTNQTAFDVALNKGTTEGGTIDGRKMAGPSGALLNYNLYTDADHSTVWGDGTTGELVQGTGTGSAVTETVYGQVPANQNSAVSGSYSDNVTVTVNY
jgi:spore coat protein U-like protein